MVAIDVFKLLQVTALSYFEEATGPDQLAHDNKNNTLVTNTKMAT